MMTMNKLSFFCLSLYCCLMASIAEAVERSNFMMNGLRRLRKAKDTSSPSQDYVAPIRTRPDLTLDYSTNSEAVGHEWVVHKNDLVSRKLQSKINNFSLKKEWKTFAEDREMMMRMLQDLGSMSVVAVSPEGTPTTRPTPSPTQASVPTTSAPVTPSPVTSPPTPQPSTTAPTFSARDQVIVDKCGLLPEQRATQISRTISSGSSSASEFDDPDSSRSNALNWVINDDEAVLCADDEDRITQRYRVALIYFQLDGDNWKVCSAAGDVCEYEDDDITREPIRWLDGTQHECEWFGLRCYSADGLEITVDDQYDINVIELADNQLSGELPVEIYDFVQLRVLTLDGNELITGYLPSEIGQLTALEFLDMDSNQLTGTIPEELYTLTNLRVLDINTNQITGTLSTSVGNLQELNVLQVENNFFTGNVPTDSLLILEKLVALTLENNDLTGSVEPLCDLVDGRRVDNNFTVYLTFLYADCLEPAEIECSCCTCF